MYAKFCFHRPNFRVFGQYLVKFWVPGQILKFGEKFEFGDFFLIFCQFLEFEEKSQILDFAQFWISGQILEF